MTINQNARNSPAEKLSKQPEILAEKKEKNAGFYLATKYKSTPPLLSVKERLQLY